MELPSLANWDQWTSQTFLWYVPRLRVFLNMFLTWFFHIIDDDLIYLISQFVDTGAIEHHFFRSATVPYGPIFAPVNAAVVPARNQAAKGIPAWYKTWVAVPRAPTNCQSPSGKKEHRSHRWQCQIVHDSPLPLSKIALICPNKNPGSVLELYWISWIIVHPSLSILGSAWQKNWGQGQLLRFADAGHVGLTPKPRDLRVLHRFKKNHVSCLRKMS